MAPGPKGKSKTKTKSKPNPKHDSEALKGPEYSASDSGLPISLAHSLWRNIPVLLLAKVVDRTYYRLSSLILRATLGRTVLTKTAGTSNVPTFPVGQSFDGCVYHLNSPIYLYSSLSRGMFVVLVYGEHPNVLAP